MKKFSNYNENKIEIKYQELKSDFIYVYENDQQAGSLILTYEGNIAKIYSLYILEKFRGKGLSKKIMEAAIINAKKNGIIKIELNTELDNDKANGLYTSMGFVKESIFEGFNHYILIF